MSGPSDDKVTLYNLWNVNVWWHFTLHVWSNSHAAMERIRHLSQSISSMLVEPQYHLDVVFPMHHPVSWECHCGDPLQGFIQRGGGGGIYPPHDFGKGGYPPHQTAEQCFFNGHFSEVLQESVQKTNPLFLANLCFLIVPPHNFFSGGNPALLSLSLPQVPRLVEDWHPSHLQHIVENTRRLYHFVVVVCSCRFFLRPLGFCQEPGGAGAPPPQRKSFVPHNDMRYSSFFLRPREGLVFWGV